MAYWKCCVWPDNIALQKAILDRLLQLLGLSPMSMKIHPVKLTFSSENYFCEIDLCQNAAFSGLLSRRHYWNSQVLRKNVWNLRKCRRIQITKLKKLQENILSYACQGNYIDLLASHSMWGPVWTQWRKAFLPRADSNFIRQKPEKMRDKRGTLMILFYINSEVYKHRVSKDLQKSQKLNSDHKDPSSKQGQYEPGWKIVFLSCKKKKKKYSKPKSIPLAWCEKGRMEGITLKVLQIQKNLCKNCSVTL